MGLDDLVERVRVSGVGRMSRRRAAARPRPRGGGRCPPSARAGGPAARSPNRTALGEQTPRSIVAVRPPWKPMTTSRPSGASEVDVGLQVRRAHVVEDDVDAAPVRGLAHLRGPVVAVGERVVGARGRGSAAASPREPAVAITCAPRAFAYWMAKEPTPPAPPCTRNVSPAARCGVGEVRPDGRGDLEHACGLDEAVRRAAVAAPDPAARRPARRSRRRPAAPRRAGRPPTADPGAEREDVPGHLQPDDLARARAAAGSAPHAASGRPG